MAVLAHGGATGSYAPSRHLSATIRHMNSQVFVRSCGRAAAALLATLVTSCTASTIARADSCDDLAKQLAGQISSVKVGVSRGGVIYLEHPAVKQAGLAVRGAISRTRSRPPRRPRNRPRTFWISSPPPRRRCSRSRRATPWPARNAASAGSASSAATTSRRATASSTSAAPVPRTPRKSRSRGRRTPSRGARCRVVPANAGTHTSQQR